MEGVLPVVKNGHVDFDKEICSCRVNASTFVAAVSMRGGVEKGHTESECCSSLHASPVSTVDPVSELWKAFSKLLRIVTSILTRKFVPVVSMRSSVMLWPHMLCVHR